MTDQKKDPPKEEQKKEPGLPLWIPAAMIRWILYSILFAAALLPFFVSAWQIACGAVILGHFSSQLNALKDKS